MKELESGVVGILYGSMFVLIMCAAYYFANSISETNKAHNAYVAEMKEYKQKNCTHVGFYGKYGEYKTYNCLGKIMKESDFQ